MRNITSECPHDEFCGGCVYQGLEYRKQLEIKEGEVHSLFSKEGISPDIFDRIEGCPEELIYEYRNKMEFTFGDMVKDGPLCLGMHRRGRFMSIVTVDQCRLVDEDFNKILSYTLSFCIEKGYKKYHKKNHTGLLRNLIIRQGKRTKELLVNIVTSTDTEFDRNGWAEGLKDLRLNNKIVGIMQTLNDNKADAVICDELILIDGRDYYYEEILGLRFQVHEFAFFQTNVEAIERLYRDAIGLIDDLEGKEVFDLYCGTGTISQVMALRAKHVLGVEIVSESVESAIENAKLNNLSNCDFVCGDVFQVLEKADLKPEKINPKADNINPESKKTDFRLEKRGLKPDVIVVDPPRIGMSTDAVNKIASYGVKQIVYISCNPKTLVKNLVQFENLGYGVKYVKPYDNFPFTRHVETVVLLFHKKPDSQINVKVEFGDENGKFPIESIAEKAEEYKPKEKVTYKMIQSYIKEKYNLKMHTAYIAEVKRNSGMKMQMEVKSEGTSQDRKSHPSKEKVEIIKDALSHFNLI